jgi:sugar phosphate isomerase/epimerase
MHLGLNTMVYEAGKVGLAESLPRIKKFGFKYVDLNAWRSGNPRELSSGQRKEIRKLLDGLGLVSSQLLLIETRDMASSDASVRGKVMDYMKACAEFQLELGGKQVLVCWGAGVYELGTAKARSWLHSVDALREYAEWCLERGVLIEMELDPHVYFIVNSLDRMAAMIEDVGMPNLFANIDIGHLHITREDPVAMEKVRGRALHVHISETDTFEHTNSIIGTGKADIKAYYERLLAMGFDADCERLGEAPVIDIEMGEPSRSVDDPDRWVSESLGYVHKVLPTLGF